MSQGDDPSISCRGACGKKVADPEAAGAAGWVYLQITRGYRCPDCEEDLRKASALVGMGDGAIQDLPPDSRGALPKETASGILPPALKG